MTHSNENTKKYFDFQAKGYARLRRLRPVESRNGHYWAVSLSFIHGDADNPEYTSVDCIVTGTDAQELLTKHGRQIQDEESKVWANVTIGDMTAREFKYKQDTQYHKAGDTGFCIKARLLYVNYMKVNGNVVFKRQRPDAGQVDQQKPATIDSDQYADVQKLDPNHPELERIKADLEAQGYQWDYDLRAMCLPKVKEAA